MLSFVSVCPSVRLFPLYLLNRLTLTFSFCVWVMTADRLGLKVKVKGQDRRRARMGMVTPQRDRSDLDPRSRRVFLVVFAVTKLPTAGVRFVGEWVTSSNAVGHVTRDVLLFSWRHPSFGRVRFPGIQLLKPPSDVGRRHCLKSHQYNDDRWAPTIILGTTHFRYLIITKTNRQDSDFKRTGGASGRNLSSLSSFPPFFLFPCTPQQEKSWELPMGFGRSLVA